MKYHESSEDFQYRSSLFPQLIAWEPEHEDEPTVVTVRPNFQDSIHVGYVPGLRKFAEYFTSVLCFTTPGDGPRSPPQLVRTHEDGTGRFRPRGMDPARPCCCPSPPQGEPPARGVPWVLSLGVFGQCLAPWDTSASVTSWIRP